MNITIIGKLIYTLCCMKLIHSNLDISHTNNILSDTERKYNAHVGATMRLRISGLMASLVFHQNTGKRVVQWPSIISEFDSQILTAEKPEKRCFPRVMALPSLETDSTECFLDNHIKEIDTFWRNNLFQTTFPVFPSALIWNNYSLFSIPPEK